MPRCTTPADAATARPPVPPPPSPPLSTASSSAAASEPSATSIKRASRTRKRTPLAERDEEYVARRREQLARAAARFKAKEAEEWEREVAENAALREETDGLRAALERLDCEARQLEEGDAAPDEHDHALVRFTPALATCADLLRNLVAEHALFLAFMRELPIPFTNAGAGDAWFVSYLTAAEAVETCKYDCQRLLAMSGAASSPLGPSASEVCFSAPIEIVRTPLVTAELRFVRQSDGAYVRVDMVGDADAINADALRVRNWFARSMTNSRIAQFFFGVDTPIEKTTHVLPAVDAPGVAAPAGTADGSRPRPIPLGTTPVSAGIGTDALPVLQAVRMVEPVSTASSAFIVCCSTEDQAVSSLQVDPALQPRQIFAFDKFGGAPTAVADSSASPESKLASLAGSRRPLELRSMRSHGVARCYTMYHTGDHHNIKSSPFTTSALAALSEAQERVQDDPDAATDEGMMRRFSEELDTLDQVLMRGSLQAAQERLAARAASGEPAATASRVPRFSARQAFYVWDEEHTEPDGTRRRLIRSTMTGKMPGFFCMEPTRLSPERLGGADYDPDTLNALGFVYMMRHRTLRLFSREAREWFSLPDSQSAARVIQGGQR